MKKKERKELINLEVVKTFKRDLKSQITQKIECSVCKGKLKKIA